MSDHEVSKPTPDVDDAVATASADDAVETVDADAEVVAADSAETQDAAGEGATLPDHAAVAQSANEALAEAERAADNPSLLGAATAPDVKDAPETPAVDPDLAAFEEAEAAYPGTFGGTFTPVAPRDEPATAADAETVAFGSTAVLGAEAVGAETKILPAPTVVPAPGASAPVAPTQVDAAPLPIFVQAPDAPRARGNRGAIFGIGLLAAVGFAVLYLGTAIGIAALNGKVTTDNIGTFALQQVQSVGLWLPVAVFAIGFWLLGAIINRGRWGFWVIFGIVVGLFAYAGHVLGAVGSVEFWKLGPSDLAKTVNGQLLAPLAIAAFVFGRELTIWFGAWAARTGARRTVQNEEAQREYERILEAGPQLPQ